MSLRLRSTLLIALLAGLFSVGATFSAAAMPGKNGESQPQQRQSLKRAQSTGALDREGSGEETSVRPDGLGPSRAVSSSALGRTRDGKSLRLAGQRSEAAPAHDEGARASATFRTLIENSVKAVKGLLANKRARGVPLTKLEESLETGSEFLLAHGEESNERLEAEIHTYREGDEGRPRFAADGKTKQGTAAAAEVSVPGVEPGRLFVNASPKSKKEAHQKENNPRYQSPSTYSGSWNHAEQNVLGDIADALDPGGKGKTVSGIIHMRVEQEACATCRTGLSLSTKTEASGVIKQFSKEFPNITLVVSDMNERELLIVRDGNMVGL